MNSFEFFYWTLIFFLNFKLICAWFYFCFLLQDFILFVLPNSIVIGSSTVILAAIAYDRYLMTRPAVYDTIMTTCRVKLILLVVWGAPLLSTSFLFINVQVFAFLITVFGVAVATVIVLCYRLIIKRINREPQANPHQWQTIFNFNSSQNHGDAEKRNTNAGSCQVSGINWFIQPSWTQSFHCCY